MPGIRNVLFIMCDQLRVDYLSCYGHPHLHTPHIDALAARGVRFTRAYVQSPICGPSRMSTYTGRYAISHGSTWNGIPLKVGEYTIGDFLRPLGLRVALAGKTHMTADLEGMARLGIDPASVIGVHLSECGFEPYERDDGLHPDERLDPALRYNAALHQQGYDGRNPWHEWANSAADPDGRLLSGWFMRHAREPARVRDDDSETPYITRRAMEFIAEAGEAPWCLHLSYIKPHWPYVAPAPYHALFGPQHVLPARRSESERTDPHPIYKSFMGERVSRAFARDEVRETVIPTYMGLIKQIDDQLGELFRFLEQAGRSQDTLVVFTSDHGDYLGDHWMGEKELFHDVSVRVPLIVADPTSAADGTRGQVSDKLVEAIDLLPTFIEALGAPVPGHKLEGRSLLPLLRGAPPSKWREFVVSEYDYSLRLARTDHGVPVQDSRLVMLADERWTYVDAKHFPPMLFDREEDPDEFHDLGRDPRYADVCEQMRARLLDWANGARQRTTISEQALAARTGKEAASGILIGYWDESERVGS